MMGLIDPRPGQGCQASEPFRGSHLRLLSCAGLVKVTLPIAKFRVPHVGQLAGVHWKWQDGVTS